MKYEVQTLFIDGWKNCWTLNNGKGSVYFTSKKEAQEEIDDTLYSSELEGYSQDDYRITEVI